MNDTGETGLIFYKTDFCFEVDQEVPRHENRRPGLADIQRIMDACENKLCHIVAVETCRVPGESTEETGVEYRHGLVAGITDIAVAEQFIACRRRLLLIDPLPSGVEETYLIVPNPSDMK